MPTVTNFSRYLSSHLDAARQSYPVLGKRPLGRTGLSVGEIGIGTSALESGGLSAVPDDEALQTLQIALDMQASLVDVACSPGENRALTLLGSAMRGRRNQTQVCLRVAGGPEEIRRNTEKALAILGTDHVDVLLWDRPRREDIRGRAAAWAALDACKKGGEALSMGVAVESPQDVLTAQESPAEVLWFPFNVFNQALVPTLAGASARGLGLIAARTLDSGWLAGRYGANHLFLDSRSRWSRTDKVRRAELQAAFERLAVSPGTTAAQVALQFVLGFPEVSCAVASVSAWQQVVGNVDASRLRLEAPVVEGLRRLWSEGLQRNPLVP